MLYLAPTRRLAALAILLSSSVIAFVILWASYLFSIREFVNGIRHALFFSFTTAALGMKGTYRLLGVTLGRTGPAIMLLLLVSLVVYFAWSRTRYFGTTAPLIVWILFLVIAVLSPHYPGFGFGLLAVPFMFVFIAGIFADLLETRYSSLAAACLLGIIAAHALWSVLALSRLSF